MSTLNQLKSWIETVTNSTVENLHILSTNRNQKIIKVQLVNKSCVIAKLSESKDQEGTNQQRIDAEVKGLLAIESQVPDFAAKILAHSENTLLLSYYPPKNPDKKHWQQLGERLAQLHQKRYTKFGFEQNNYCGESQQINTYASNGTDFFVENRLKIQIQQAYRNKLLDLVLYNDLLKLAHRLSDWIPVMPAVLIHGDLWSGNQLSTECGAKLIDPACYYGWAEADLAMTKMFSGFDQSFYQAYKYHSQMSDEWLARVPLYNLYHQLNHLNIFGTSYLSGVVNTLRAYV